MKDIQKTLVELTHNRPLDYYKENSTFYWSFNIGNNSNLKLENIVNDLIKITIKTEKKTEKKSKKLGKVSVEKHTIVNVNQIKEFILAKINDVNESRYKDDLMKEEKHYKTIIDTILQNKSIKDFQYEVNLKEKKIYINESLVKNQTRKTDITTDFIHKLSKSLVDDAVNKEIKFIIVGKNLGWKNEINNGKTNNRAMYNFPHARFIELLKYKAMLNDILVIETEESYTSKTSFIDNEELSEYSPAKTTQDTKNQLLGKRKNQLFITKDKIKLHADLNGGFNIARKVLKHFVYKKKQITLTYRLVELNLHGKHKVKTFCGPLAKSLL